MSNQKYNFMTQNEVAEYLSIQPETLAHWRCRGSVDLPYFKIGGKIRYKLEDVENFIEKSRFTKEELS